MRKPIIGLFLMAAFFANGLTLTAQQDLDSKVSKLLSQMTLEEKVGQMTQIDAYNISDTKLGDTLVIDEAKLTELITKYHIGSLLNTPRALKASTWYQVSKKIQEVNMKNSRLKIPVIFGIDHMHGASYVLNSTIFPHNISTACTFNSDYAGVTGAVTAFESADLGHHWVFAPVLDLGRNPYFPRFYETYGEDPYLASRMGAAYVKGLQENAAIAPYKVAACAKHFIGYSDPRSGWDRTPAEISEQNLQDLFRPSFQAVVDAGIKTFMICSGEVNGIPVHGSYALLTDLLRNQMGFKGVAVTDWEDIILLHKTHHIAENEKEATFMAIMAGIDMSMTPYTTHFNDYLVELVKEGRIPMSRIDLSVGRILKLKYELGLFDHPYPRKDRLNRVGLPENQAKSLEAAREAIVLMKNSNHTLPLSSSIKNILLAGPNANVKRSLCGGWSFTWQGDDERFFPPNMPTVYAALRKEFPNSKIELVTDTFTRSEQARAVFKTKAAQADVIVFAAGETPFAEGVGNINDLSLSVPQSEMISAIAETGKPSVLVLIEARPRVLSAAAKKLPAIVYAGLPGIHGATAIAEVLSGKTNPSGKLSFTYPAFVGHLVPYNKKNAEKTRMHKGFDTTFAICEFGQGLSYTSYEYSDLNLSDTLIKQGRQIKASITVKNTGKVPGKEAVLWYLSDEVRSVTPPVKQLKYFEKQALVPGESKTFVFNISPENDLWFRDAKGNKLTEPGYFTLRVGDKAARFRLIK